MTGLKRRDALAGVVSVGALGLAGCLSSEGSEPSDENGGDGTGDDAPNGSGGDSENGTETDHSTAAVETSAITEATIETTGTELAGPDSGDARLNSPEHSLVVTGDIVAGTPCHGAVLASVAVDDDILRVVVDTEDGETAGEPCVTSDGEIAYEATLELADGYEGPADFETVTVDHVGGDTYTLVNGALEPVADGGDGTGGGDSGDDSIAETTLETGGVADGQSNDEYEVAHGEATTTVEGTLTLSSPHHAPYLETVSFDDGVLTVVLENRSTLEEGQAGTLPLEAVDYEVTVDFTDPVTVDTVNIAHPVAEPVESG